ncbi:MAG: T9SS type A sorting domain-containing protein [Chryseolinea sp.]
MATNYWSLASGQWSTTSSTGPSCGVCQPDGTGDVIIVNHNITIPSSIVIGNGSKLTINAGQLTISGNLTLNNGSIVFLAANASLKVNGNFENKNNSNNVTFNGNVNITGSFTNGTGGAPNTDIDLGPNGTITVGGACSNKGNVIQNGVSFNGCIGPLPVQLIFFRAVQQSSAVLLTWATASEKGFAYFGIERAGDDLNWIEVGQVEGSGDSKERIEYSYTDNEITTVGKIYYRLKAVDIDGYTEFFNVIAVDVIGTKAWAVTPNPTEDGKIVLTRNFSDDQPVTATVCSVGGAPLFSEQISFVSNQYTFNKNLNPGMYLMTIRTASNTKYLRFVVH